MHHDLASPPALARPQWSAARTPLSPCISRVWRVSPDRRRIDDGKPHGGSRPLGKQPARSLRCPGNGVTPAEAQPEKERPMAVPTFTMRQLMEAGVHFGHHTRRWNPRMAPYIFGVRNGIHILDLQQTVPMLYGALNTARSVVSGGGRVLFEIGRAH